MRSCVRPVYAVLFPAGPDEVRVPGSIQSIGFGILTAPRSVPVCGPLFDHHHFHLPLHLVATGFGGRNAIALRHGRCPIGFTAGQNGPCDAGGLVGHGDGGEAFGLAFDQRSHPGPGCGRDCIGSAHNGCRTNNE